MTCRRSTVDSAVWLFDEAGSVRDIRLLWCSGERLSCGLLAAWFSWSPIFRESLPYASLRVKILTLEVGIDTLFQNLKILTLEVGIDTLSRNVGTNQPTLCSNPKEQKSEGASRGNILELWSRDAPFESWLGHCIFGVFFSFSAAILGKYLDSTSNYNHVFDILYNWLFTYVANIRRHICLQLLQAEFATTSCVAMQ
jgi:hypothetical protein